MWCCSLCTSRLWWITHLTQCQRSGYNTTIGSRIKHMLRIWLPKPEALFRHAIRTTNPYSDPAKNINTTFTCQATVCKNETPVLTSLHHSIYTSESDSCGRCVGKHLLCRLVNKGLYGVGKHVHWLQIFTNLAIAIHASHEVGAGNYRSCCTL